MHQQTMPLTTPSGDRREVTLFKVHTLVIGSGAAGLNAAVQLHANGIEDICIVTEGLDKGTSINTGSDKQTYYKLSMCGADLDSPRTMAQTYFDGGGMHGDLALVEAALSARAFMHLVNIGVPFPRDAYGQFVGYKTDHDPRQRATSVGPYTSRDMCRSLIAQVRQRRITVHENRVAVQLLTTPGVDKRCCGALVLNGDGDFEIYSAENVIFAVGGPGGLYATAVYPAVQTGAIGLALLAGAAAQNLTESQYGLASVKFRWNVSGTYMQVVPRFISTDADGCSNPREFLREYFNSAGTMNSMVFLKGYQWPFDPRKVIGGSSLIDILVYQETARKGRRVFLDYTRNPDEFSFEALSVEARMFLEKSGATLGTPIERLSVMNPAAVELYREHGIDISREPLEIAVCAQHNNGGLAANHWWESVNISHLFPIGEVNGSHGVYRPGGASLNSGQVGGFRAAEFIANRYSRWTIDDEVVSKLASDGICEMLEWFAKSSCSRRDWRSERREFQDRMSLAGAHIRSPETIARACTDSWTQWQRLNCDGVQFSDKTEWAEAIRTRYLCYAHAVYLDAIAFALASGVGSRGSSIALRADGARVHEKLDDEWRMIPENTGLRLMVLETRPNPGSGTQNLWVPCRPIPELNSWFETTWAQFRSGRIYD